jgi:ketosteroid isomerase-like protein
VSEQTTCEPLSHENVAWAGIPQTTHPGSYQLLASPAKVGSSTEVRCQCGALHGKQRLWRDTAWAMSEENVEVVRKAIAYEYHGVGDRAEAEAIFDPDVVLNPIDEGPSHGPDEMRYDWERWASAFEELRVTFEEIIDAGDQVVVVAHHEGRGQGSGIEVDARFYEVYTLREGKVSRVDEYTEREEALEAAGLSE